MKYFVLKVEEETIVETFENEFDVISDLEKNGSANVITIIMGREFEVLKQTTVRYALLEKDKE